MPLDLVALPAGEHRIAVNRRVFGGDQDWQAISSGWATCLHDGFFELPPVEVTL